MNESDRAHDVLSLAADESTRNLGDPTGQLLRRIRSRRRRRSVLAIASAVTATVAVFATVAAWPGRPSVGPSNDPPVVRTHQVTVAELSKGTWSKLPRAPLGHRLDATVGWSGRRLLVWGGRQPNGENVRQERYLGDGAAFDPATGSWTKLPKSPLTARAKSSSVWTGREWIVWGGYDGYGIDSKLYVKEGAAYDPARRTWRRIADAPADARAVATLLWTGREVVVVGGEGDHLGDFESTTVTAYNPAENTWRKLADLPPYDGDLPLVSATLGGQDLYVARYWRIPPGPKGEWEVGMDLLRYDWDDGSWQVVAPQASFVPGRIGSLSWVGDNLLTMTYDNTGAAEDLRRDLPIGYRLDPKTGSWRELPKGPDGASQAISVPIDNLFARLDIGGSFAVWDSATNAWTALPRAPFRQGELQPIWAGDQLLAWKEDSAFRFGS